MDIARNAAENGHEWIIEMVERGLVGEYTSHIFDSRGRIHIFYFDHIYGNLKHASRGEDGWIIETVDQEGTVGQYLSVMVDTDDRIYISYRDQGKNRLKFAVLDEMRWNFEIVDEEPFASLDTSIFVDTTGRIFISYYNFSEGCLKLATKENGHWKVEVVDPGEGRSAMVGGFTSIKGDSGGRLHISYTDSTNGLLKYALKDNGSWKIEVADDSEFVSNFTSLALDREGNPHISYTVDKRPNKPDLWLARRIGNKWRNELIDTDEITGNYSCIAVDPTDNIFISYSCMGKLKVAANIEGIWSFEIVDSTGTVTYTSLSLDKDRMPHISYHDKERGVKYAHKVKVA